ALENEMRRLGAEAPSFDSIVASAERGALPHAQPTDVPIPRGTLVTLDIGARLDGYCSDCTRTWATGELPDDLAEAYALVQRAQAESLAAVRPGPSGREVDAVARRIIEEAGHGEHFGHGLGHGVGLEVHEAPRLARAAEGRIAAGCGSRISSWSPRTAIRSCRGPRRTSFSWTRGPISRPAGRAQEGAWVV